MSKKTVELTCFYFGVGQGLFTAGLLEESDGPNSFAWVYDCGYSTKIEAPLVDQGIRTLHHRIKKSTGGSKPKPVIDLLVISHFDRDHIAGISALLQKFRVERVLLPFSSLAQRVSAAFDQGQELSERELRYFVNPVQFLAEIDDGDIGDIAIVPPSDPAQRPPPPNGDQPPPDDTWSFEMPRTDDLEKYGSAEGYLRPVDQTVGFSVLREAAVLKLGGFWEFVPYNDAELANKVSPAFAAKVQALSKELIDGTLPLVTREAALTNLKALYESTFAKNGKKNSKNNNLISLFISAGTTRLTQVGGPDWRYWRIDERARAGRGRKDSRLMVEMDMGSFSRTGVRLLYTGDAYLDSTSRLSCLRTYLGKARTSPQTILQVMHHGSKHNWYDGLATDLSPAVSVFSSDPNHSWGHPHAEVLRDFWPYGAVQVDSRSSLTVGIQIDI